MDTLRHLTEALDVGWLGMGATTKDFEERIAAYLSLGARRAVATNTGTSAFHIALLAAGVGPGDEVITPSFNYVADHQAIRMAGAEPVMCDIEERTLGIDCNVAESLLTPRTKAIIPLHFAGIPCEQSRVYDLAKKYGLRVIEDACHAFGTTIDGRPVGSYGDISVFSFDPVKIVTSIDGGCVVVNTEEEMVKLHRLRLLGVDKDTTERYKNKRAWDYDVVSDGFRYHLTNIMASVGVSQIKRVDDFIRSRVNTCRRYNRAFCDIDGLATPPSDFDNVSPFIYSLRVRNDRRQELIEHLSERGIDTGIHFVPVHKHTHFADCRKSEMVVTEKVCSEVLTLPLHSFMEEEHVQRVIDGVIGFPR